MAIYQAWIFKIFLDIHQDINLTKLEVPDPMYLETDITEWLFVLDIEPGLDNFATANTLETILQENECIMLDASYPINLGYSKW